MLATSLCNQSGRAAFLYSLEIRLRRLSSIGDSQPVRKKGVVKIYKNLFLFRVNGQNVLHKIVSPKIKVFVFALGFGIVAARN